MTSGIALPIRGLLVAGLSITFAAGASALVGAQQPPAASAAQAPAPAPPPPPPAEMPKPVAPVVSATAPTPDPRPNLKAGRWDAEQAAWNMRMLSTTPPRDKALGSTHSDLAFSGNLVIQGHYNGFDIYDISNPSKRPICARPHRTTCRCTATWSSCRRRLRTAVRTAVSKACPSR